MVPPLESAQHAVVEAEWKEMQREKERQHTQALAHIEVRAFEYIYQESFSTSPFSPLKCIRPFCMHIM